jgi:2-keto-4-pentenoate hydratase
MDSLSGLAARQLSDYDAHRPGMWFAATTEAMTVEEAYRLQFAVAALRIQRGEVVAGYKIGCVSAAIQRQLGLSQPAFGHIWSTELHRSGVTLNPALFEGLAVEGELAVQLSEDGRTIAAAFPVIELHNNVFRRERTSAELISNNAIHAGVVLPVRRDGILPEEISVSINGKLLGHASTLDTAASVDLVAAHLRSWGKQLEGGQIVLTGTTLPLYSVGSGDQIDVHGGGGSHAWARIA